SKLPSANKFLERMYEVVGPDGKPREKPAFEDVLDGKVTYKHKQLSAKTKVTKVDEFMKTLFDDFLGVKPNGSAVKVLTAVAADQLQAKYPDLALSKDEKEGMFFEIGDTILSVYAKTEYFSR